jgi:hypothetical protein
MENLVRLQHYVPKVYLKNFSKEINGKFFIQCFDKQTSKIFPVNIEKIAYEEEFYDKIDEEQKLERNLRKIETRFGKAINHLISKKDLSGLNNEDFESILDFIAIQMIRTKEIRIEFKQTAKQFLDNFGNKLSGKLKKEVGESIKEESLRKNHKKFILKNGEIFKEIIKKMKCILILNESVFPLWTSDNPVVEYNSIDHFPYGNLGLNCIGIEIHFPITPKLCLLVCDPISFQLEPNKKITKDYRHIVRERDLQIRNSTRFVFSNENNFNFAKAILREKPELKDPDRKRFKVN